MYLGVFTSAALEIAVTEQWALCLSARPEEDVLRAALYRGGGQYFRLRNLGDNSAPFCGFHSDLGKPVPALRLPDAMPDGQNACFSTGGGLFWPVLRHSEREIVLAGCGEDEYVYRGDTEKSEYFTLS